MQSVPVAVPSTRPPVILAFQIFCGVMILIYLVATAGGMLLLRFYEKLDMPRDEGLFVGVLLAVLCIPFAILYALPYFLPRKPWVWIYDLVLIAGGMTSCLTLPFSIALLIYWIRPDTKLWFGRTV